MNKKLLIEKLGLTAHKEGGYFSETYRCAVRIRTDREGETRNMSTSIYYMLTDDRPVGYFHTNKSDVVHYFHAGSSLRYWLIGADGRLQSHILGPDVAEGEKLQLIVPGGVWKATELLGGEFGLLGESVAPGFEYQDNVMGSAQAMSASFPDLWERIENFVVPGLRYS